MDASLATMTFEVGVRPSSGSPGPLSLATSGVISTNRDVDGVELERLHERVNDQESMCCQIVAVHGEVRPCSLGERRHPPLLSLAVIGSK